VECFAQKKSRLSCTLLLQWEEGYEHPWAVITDRSPQEAKVAWYGLRSWIEASFKDSKSGGATSQSCRLASCQLKNLYLKGDQSRPYGDEDEL